MPFSDALGRINGSLAGTPSWSGCLFNKRRPWRLSLLKRLHSLNNLLGTRQATSHPLSFRRACYTVF